MCEIRDQKTRYLSVTLYVVIAAIYLPVVMIFVYSFNKSRIGTVWTGFSLKWYGDLASREELWQGLETSILIGVIASTISIAFGTMAAFGFRKWRKRISGRIGLSLLFLPMVIPDIVMAVSLASFFYALGTEQGLATVVLAHVTFGLAYAYVVMSAAINDIDDTLIHAANDLGATPWQTFRKVLLPIITPSISVAWLLVFSLSFDDFLITFFTKGIGNDTLPILISSQMRFGIRPGTNCLFVLLFTLTLLGAGFSMVQLRKVERQFNPNESS